MTLSIKPRKPALAASVMLAAAALFSCQPTASSRRASSHRAPALDAQDVSAEWEPAVPGSADLCDSPRAVITFDKPIERQVFDVLTAYNTGLDESMERLTAKVIVEEATRYNMDPWLVVGVIRVESRFYNFAESNRNARGLMQLRPFVAQELAGNLGISWTGPDTLYNPIKNVKLGTAYLALLNHRFGSNLDRTLAAYNMGPNRVRDWMKAGRELPTGYASLVTDYKGMLGTAGKTSPSGTDLRGPITEIERHMARRARAVILPVVADNDPSDNGIATGAAVKGLISPEPEFDAATVKSPEAHGKLGQELDPTPEPEVKAAVDPELEAILK